MIKIPNVESRRKLRRYLERERGGGGMKESLNNNYAFIIITNMIQWSVSSSGKS